MGWLLAEKIYRSYHKTGAQGVKTLSRGARWKRVADIFQLSVQECKRLFAEHQKVIAERKEHNDDGHQ